MRQPNLGGGARFHFLPNTWIELGSGARAVILFFPFYCYVLFLYLTDIQTQLTRFLSFSKKCWKKKVIKHYNLSLFANLTFPGGVQGNVVAGTVLVLWTVPWK